MGVACGEARHRRRGAGAVKVARRCCAFIGGLAVLTVLALGLVVGLLAHGPIAIDGLGPRIAEVLGERFGRGAVFALGTTSLIKRGFGPSFGVDGLTISGPDGQVVLSAPRAEVSIDPLPLLYAQVVPKRLEVFDVELRLVLLKNGNLAVAAGGGSKPFFELARGSEEAPPSAVPPAAPSPVTSSPPPTSEPIAPLAALTQPRRAAAMQQAGKGIRLLLDAITNPDSPLAAIDRLGIKRGKLLIEDQTSDEEVVYRDLDLEFNKVAEGTTLVVSAQGPSQRWTIEAKASGRPGAERTFQIDVKNLSQDELQLAAGTRTPGFDSDMPLSMSFRIGLTPNDALSEANASFSLGPGFFRLEDPDQEPLLIERCTGGFHWNGAVRRIEIDRTVYEEGSTRFVVGGAMTPPLNEGEPWTISMATSEAGVLGPDRIGQRPVVIDGGQFTARLFPDRKQMIIDRFAFGSGKEGGLAMAGQIDWEHGPRVRLGASIDPTSVRVAQRVWPAFAASPARAWLLSHFEDGTLQTGTLRIDYDGDALLRMRSDRAPPDDSIALDFTLSKARLAFLPGVPPLQDVSGSGHITGRTTHFNLTSGALEANGRRIAVNEGSFVIADSDHHPVPATISAHVSGSVEAIGDLLSRDALKAYASLPLDPATLKGQVDGRLEERLMLGEEEGHGEPELRINAAVTNFSADKLIGKEKLDNASMTLTVDPAGMKAVGQGRIAGAPATFEIMKSGDKPPDALITTTLDDAARAKMGLSAIPGLTGAVAGRIAVSGLGQSGKMKAQVELDLGKAGVTAAFLGLAKPVGKPAKISFGLTPGEARTLIDPLAIDIGSLQARGSVELGGDNSFQGAHFSSIKVSPGDDMKLDVGKSDDTFKLTIRGSTIDARPFLRALTQLPGDAASLAKSAKAEKREADAFKGFDVDLKSGILTGFNKEVMSDVDLKLSKRGAQVHQFAVQGKFGRNALSGSMGANQRVRLATQDAGALVSFIDLYKHMEGGQLVANMTMGDDAMSGNMEIASFTLRDEPAMKKLVAQSMTSSQPGDSASTAARSVDANAVGFTKLKVNFQRNGSRIELKDATMYGPAIGLSVDGWLDYVHDRVGMTGTFVPAFAVNNLFSQVPVIGFFLGGASNEGLFAINFRISGSAASPTLSVNPLSAIAPGFLRKIFGALDTSGGANAAPEMPEIR